MRFWMPMSGTMSNFASRFSGTARRALCSAFATILTSSNASTSAKCLSADASSGVLAQTVSVRRPEFRARLATVFATWDGQLQRLLAEAQVVGEIDPQLNPKDVAAFLIEAYEGR